MSTAFERADPGAAFDVPFPSRTIAGAGAADLAGAELARLGVRRPGIVAPRSVAAGSVFGRWRERLGSELPLFTEVVPHTPRDRVLAAARVFRAGGCDGVVSFGGGSAIDTAKAAALALAVGIEEPEEFDRYVGGREPDGSPRHFVLDAAVPPHVAVPTTLSGAAHTHSAGVSDPGRGEKILHIHPSLGPRVVLLDPLVAQETPVGLWTSTGIKALEHAVEALYSKALPPLLEPMRMRAFTLLATDLVGSVAPDVPEDDRLRSCARLLVAAGLSVFAWPSGPLGVSHALGHQAGATWQIGHGYSAAIFLPRALAFNAPAAGEPLRAMARALGGADGASDLDAIRARLDSIFQALALPTRLSQVGVDSPELFEHLADAALRDPIMAGNPREATRSDLLELLHDAL